MRSNEEIVERIKSLNTLFGTQESDLTLCLPYEFAKQFLKEGTTEEQWNGEKLWVAPTDEDIVNKIKDYMNFAFGKALDERGLSAMRSLEHMQAWLWLINNPLWENITRYTHSYGIENLKQICESFGLDHTVYMEQ